MKNAPENRGVFCFSGPVRMERAAQSGLRVHSSPCIEGMSWVGAIGVTGLAGTAPVVTGAATCTSADFGAGAATCCTGAAGAGLAASGLAFGIGTARLAT